MPKREHDRLNGRGIQFYVQTLFAGMGLIGLHEGMELVNRWTGGRLGVPRVIPLSRRSAVTAVAAIWHTELCPEILDGELLLPHMPEIDPRGYQFIERQRVL